MKVMIFVQSEIVAYDDAMMPLVRTLAERARVTVLSYNSRDFFPGDRLAGASYDYLPLSDGGLDTIPRVPAAQYAAICGDDIDFFRSRVHAYGMFDYPLTRDYLFKDSPLYQKHYGLALRIEPLLGSISPDCVLVLGGGEPVSKILYAKCCRMDVPVLLWESSFLRGRLLVDSVGMHFFPGVNRIDRDWPEVKKRNLTASERKKLETFLAEWKASRASKHDQPTDSTELEAIDACAKSGRKILFFPGQLPLDANVLTALGRFGAYDEILPFICEKLPEDWLVIHKVHPVNRESKLPRGFISDRCFVAKDVNIHHLLSLADAVFVLSTNVGLEALIYEKPVICCGTPHYAHKGLTLDLDDRDDFVHTLAASQEFRIDPAVRERFLHYVIFDYLIEEGDTDALLGRLAEVKPGKCHTDPRAPFSDHYPEVAKDYLGLLADYNRLAGENHTHVEILSRLAEGGHDAFQERIDEALRTEASSEIIAGGERQVAAELADIKEDHLIRYAFAGEVVGEDAAILDFTCGTGYGSHILSRISGSTVEGVDGSAAAVRFANANWHADNVTFTCESAGSWKPQENAYDAVVSLETIEHLADDIRFVRKLWRALKPGGPLVFSAPNADRLGLGGHIYHVRHYRASDIRALFAAFKDVETLVLLGQGDDNVIATRRDAKFFVGVARKSGGNPDPAPLAECLEKLLPFAGLPEGMSRERRFKGSDLAVLSEAYRAGDCIFYSDALREKSAVEAPFASFGPYCRLAAGAYELDLRMEVFRSLRAVLRRRHVEIRLAAGKDSRHIRRFLLSKLKRSGEVYQARFVLENDSEMFQVLVVPQPGCSVLLREIVIRERP